MLSQESNQFVYIAGKSLKNFPVECQLHSNTRFFFVFFRCGHYHWGHYGITDPGISLSNSCIKFGNNWSNSVRRVSPQTDRQEDRETNRQIGRQTDRQQTSSTPQSPILAGEDESPSFDTKAC